MELPTFFLEQRDTQKGLVPVGVDEAGRGPLAGPVVAAAVFYKDSLLEVPEERVKEFTLIRDSKKLSPAQREKAFILVQEFFEIGVGIISAETIDRVNILQASFLAMKAAISDVQKKLPVEKRNSLSILIDGNQILPAFSGVQEAVVKGESVSRSIAAASIIAKVTRDHLFVEYEKQYPGYGFAQHKGYGTKEHMEALQRLGATPIHRKSFKPVQLASPEAVNKKFSKILAPHKK